MGRWLPRRWSPERSQSGSDRAPTACPYIVRNFRAVIGYLFVNVVSRALAGLCALVLAALLPIEEYAAFGIAYAYQVAIASVSSAGFPEFALRVFSATAEGPERRVAIAAGQRAAWIRLSFAILCAGCFALVSGSGGGSMALLGCAAICGACSGWSSNEAVAMRMLSRHADSQRLLATFAFGPSSALLLGAIFGGSAFAAYVSAALVSVLAICLLARARLSRTGSIGGTSARKALRFSLPFVVIAVAGWLTGFGINPVIDTCINAASVANFTLLLSVANLVQLLPNAISMAWMPSFADQMASSSPHEGERASCHFFGRQAVIMGAIGAVITIGFPFACEYLGDGFVDRARLGGFLALLIVSNILAAPKWHVDNMLIAADRPAVVFKAILLSMAVGTPVWIIMIAWLGEPGVYWGYLLQLALRSFSAVLLARRAGVRSAPLALTAAAGALAALGWTVSCVAR